MFVLLCKLEGDLALPTAAHPMQEKLSLRMQLSFTQIKNGTQPLQNRTTTCEKGTRGVMESEGDGMLKEMVVTT